MDDIAIRVQNLSKEYRIGGPQARYKTIRESLTEAEQAPFRRLSTSDKLRTRPSTSMRKMEDGGGRGEWKAVEQENENMERGGA